MTSQRRVLGELREVRATEQAIRADRPRPVDVSGSATGTIRVPASREGD